MEKDGEFRGKYMLKLTTFSLSLACVENDQVSDLHYFYVIVLFMMVDVQLATCQQWAMCLFIITMRIVFKMYVFFNFKYLVMVVDACKL